MSWTRCLLTLLMIPALASGATQDLVVVTDRDAPAPSGVQARPFGSRAVWIAPAGTAPALPADAQVLEPGDSETLYLVEEHAIGADVAGRRTVAAWEGFRIVAVSDPNTLQGLSHCFERLRWITPPPLPTEQAALRRTDPAIKQALVDEVDLTRYTTIVRQLSGDLPLATSRDATTIVTRSTYSDGVTGGIDDAIDFLRQEFAAAGYTLIEQSFPAPLGRTGLNLIASRPGTVHPDEVVVVGAHYDSISEMQTALAPGAEDNASGAAAVLHLAEVFADVTTERTVHFVSFGVEEQGLYGSQHYVDQLTANGWTVVGALTMDMISAWATDFGVLIEGNVGSDALMQALRANVQGLGVLSSALSYNPFGSDHMPFIQAGLPALLAIDLDWAEYSDYHRSTDTFDKIDPTLGYQIARAIAGTAVDLAGISTVVGIDDDDPPLPGASARLALSRPRPNPFNPRTEIGFAIPDAGPVTLRIHDARGRIVRTLVDSPRPAGEDAVVWNGQDDFASDVASGLYFVRLEHDGQVRTERLTLVR